MTGHSVIKTPLRRGFCYVISSNRPAEGCLIRRPDCLHEVKYDNYRSGTTTI
jgi:hypothetical protein